MFFLYCSTNHIPEPERETILSSSLSAIIKPSLDWALTGRAYCEELLLPGGVGGVAEGRPDAGKVPDAGPAGNGPHCAEDSPDSSTSVPALPQIKAAPFEGPLN